MDPTQALNGGVPRLDMESVKFGLINAMRTGNVLLDTMLCCLIPLVVSLVFSQLTTLREWWTNHGLPMLKRLIFGATDLNAKPTYTRTLTTKRAQNNSYNGQQTDKTKQLMTGISMYIKTLNKTLRGADVSLVDIEDGVKSNNYYYYYGNTNNDDKDAFDGHELLWEPQSNLWLEVADGVEFMRLDETTENQGENKAEATSSQTVTYSMRSTEDDGDKRIDAFLQTAFDWYKAQLNSRKDNTRYFYFYLAKADFGEAGNTQGYNYKRFALSDEKTFESIFFPAKDELMNLLDAFKNKTGRYAIKGSAHKLGLLLHGPPGTGKTSFIKALANHFGRHIISIPLARIETNEELIDLMFDLSFKVAGSDYPVKLTYSQILWVFEDVDAASDVVQRRAPPPDGKSAKKTTTIIRTSEHILRQPTQQQQLLEGLVAAGGGNGGTVPLDSGASMAIERATSLTRSEGAGSILTPRTLTEGEGLVTTIIKEVSHEHSANEEAAPSKRREKPKKKESLELLEETSFDDDGDDGISSDEEVTDLKGKKKFGPSKWFERKDKLNLAGLLEVLDGVIDTPGRLIVMSSNHPEKLDPALIRPGRIDKKIKLTYLAPREAVQMTEHFLGPISEGDKAAISAILLSQRDEATKVVTPAVLEQLCTECDTPEKLIPALEKLVKSGTDSL